MLVNALIRTFCLAAVFGCVLPAQQALALTTTSTPYNGITYITRTGESVGSRTVNMHIVEVDLRAQGVGFAFTSPGGSLDTVRQSTLGYLDQTHAQVAVNGEFFLPFPSSSPDANLVGFAASAGTVYSGFEAPTQSYAIVTNAAAINIAPDNSASVVHADTAYTDGKHVMENVTIGTAFAGSAQIVTNGQVTIPYYKDATHPDGLLTTNGTYSNSNSWYNLFNARTAIGLTQDNSKLFIFTVDNAGGSNGLSVGQVASILVNDYQVYNALNMDGGGSTALAMRDPLTGIAGMVNSQSDPGRLEGSNLVIFAMAVPEPETYAMFLAGLGLMVLVARRRCGDT